MSSVIDTIDTLFGNGDSEKPWFTPKQISDTGLILSVGGALTGAISSYVNAETNSATLKYQGHISALNATLDAMNAERFTQNARSIELNAKAEEINAEFQTGNANMAEMGRQQALIKGQTEAAQMGLQAGQLEGTQKAEMAANGVDLSSGSAAEVQASTEIMKTIDMNTVEANALRDSFGYQQQEMNFSNEAVNARMSAANYLTEATNQKLQAIGARQAGITDEANSKIQEAGGNAISPVSAMTSTLLGGLGTVAQNWYERKAWLRN